MQLPSLRAQPRLSEQINKFRANIFNSILGINIKKNVAKPVLQIFNGKMILTLSLSISGTNDTMGAFVGDDLPLLILWWNLATCYSIELVHEGVIHQATLICNHIHHRTWGSRSYKA